MTSRLLATVVMSMILGAVGAQAQVPATGERTSAEWQVHQVRFWYAGFSTYYTCDSVERKVRKLLLELGARSDAEVRAPCRGNRQQVWPQHNMVLAFAVPIPADDGLTLEQNRFEAEWQDFEIKRRRPRNIDNGDCELVEQFMKVVGPYFGPVELNNRTRCVPRRVNLGSPYVKGRVLKALEMPEEKFLPD